VLLSVLHASSVSHKRSDSHRMPGYGEVSHLDQPEHEITFFHVTRFDVAPTDEPILKMQSVAKMILNLVYFVLVVGTIGGNDASLVTAVSSFGTCSPSSIIPSSMQGEVLDVSFFLLREISPPFKKTKA
jgi:hypothetical protein